jgi:hypothetical protein
MLRTTLLILLIGAAGACGQPRDAVVGVEVRADDGTLLGEVTSVERDRAGRIIAAEIEGLEPADAPDFGPELLADENEPIWVRTSVRPASSAGALRASR